MSDNSTAAKAYAVKLLSYRMYTCKEIWDRLTAKGFNEDSANGAMRELCEGKLLDDFAYASLYILDCYNLKQWGGFRIRMELTQKGVDKSVIDRAFAESSADEYDVLLAYATAYARGRTFENRNDVEKLKAHLYRRGFSAENIGCVVKEMGL